LLGAPRRPRAGDRREVPPSKTCARRLRSARARACAGQDRAVARRV